ncbi:MAG: OmpA family protein [Phaeodactylibacter sp.]|uniref:OmpA family protein n=1 Tax=Phaeodactylibacter sp. TaxID=1940289 RepID=UPI0032EB5FD0
MKNPFLSLLTLIVTGCCAVASIAQGTLQEVVNTRYDESYPVVNIQGDALYFARFGHPSNRGEQNASDVWATYKSDDGVWAKPVNVGAPVNTKAEEWPLSLNTSGKQLLVYAAGKSQLQSFRQTGRFWNLSNTQHLQGGHASVPDAFFQIAQDNHHLISVLPQKANPAHKDLHLSTRTQATEWSVPQALPQTVNSPSDEQSAYLAPDNRTLYFASNRPGGFGGYDLYMTKRKGADWYTWSTPVNLGPGINTKADELFISVPAAGSPAFIARRPVGSDMDILQLDMPERLRPVALRLVNGVVQVDRQSLVGEAEVRLENTGEGRVVQMAEVEADGTYSLLLPAEETGVVFADLPGYFPVVQPVQSFGVEMVANAMASNDQTAVISQQEADIRSLHLHLERLDSELNGLRQQRQEALNAMRAHNYEADLPLSSDPEIEALRHRYRYFTEVAAHQDTLPDNEYDEAADTERELADMQARFKRYYVHEKSRQEAQSEIKEGDRHLWEEQPTFEELQAQAKSELEEAIIPEVEKRLIQDMEVPISVEPSPALTESERTALEQKARQLQSQIKEGLAGTDPSTPDWVAKGGFQQPETEPEAWEDQVLDGLKEAMHDEVEQALKPQLEARVYDLVETDGQYQVKKLERSMVRKKLDQKIAQQLSAEPASQVAAEPDAVAPLVPAPPATPSRYEEVQQDLLLIPAEVGRNIPLNSVAFDAGTDRLQPAAYPELNRLLAFLNQHPGLVVEVGAHVGSQYSYAKALDLTDHRAKVVAAFLIGNGIDPDRLLSKGYGKAFPKPNPAFSERLEIRIIGQN